MLTQQEGRKVFKSIDTNCIGVEMFKLNMALDEDEVSKITSLKEKFGIKQTTELVRLLITIKYEEIQKERNVK